MCIMYDVYSTESHFSNIKCHQCGQPGHIVRDCPVNKRTPQKAIPDTLHKATLDIPQKATPEIPDTPSSPFIDKVEDKNETVKDENKTPLSSDKKIDSKESTTTDSKKR